MKPVVVTPRQLDLLQFIHRFRQENDFAPCHREMMEALGISSTCGIADHLSRLERKGLIIRRARLQRALRLTEAGLRLVQQAEARRRRGALGGAAGSPARGAGALRSHQRRAGAAAGD